MAPMMIRTAGLGRKRLHGTAASAPASDPQGNYHGAAWGTRQDAVDDRCGMKQTNRSVQWKNRTFQSGIVSMSRKAPVAVNT